MTMHEARLLRTSGLLATGIAVIALTGCGSSSSSSSHTSSTSAATPHPRTIPSASAATAGAKPDAGTLAKLRTVAKGGHLTAHLGGLGKLSLTQATQVVSGDINKFWSQEFASSGVQWPPMQDVIVDTSAVSTQCSRSTVAPTDSWYLCDSTSGGTFYWTIPWMQQNIATDQGGVNLAFSMAELWSFHILNLVGATDQLQSGKLSSGAWAQGAACLTGIYARSLSDRKLFEQGDQQTVQAFVQALSSIGGIGSPDVSGQQLQQAFVAGFNSGQPSGCGIGSGGGNSGNSGGGQTTTTTNGGGNVTTPLGSTS
jgi:hypothetical protein